MKKKLVISLIIVVAIFIIVAVLCYYFFTKSNSLESEIVGSNDEVIEIICESEIDIFIDENDYLLEYNIKNPDNINYTTKIEIEGDCITLEGSYIKPLKVGESSIIINVKTNTKVYSKTITVNVKPIVQNVELCVVNDLNEKVNYCFVGESYYLCIDLDESLDDDFYVDVSDNVSKFELVENIDKKLRFAFSLSGAGDTKFIFKYRSIEEEFNIKAFSYITDFNVNFSNSFDNDIITLYLFNNNYINEAVDDDIYSSTEFTVNLLSDNISDYSINVSNDCVLIDGNKIIATKAGECAFFIEANDGSLYEEQYKIVVETVELADLAISTNATELFVGESTEITIDYSPIYAICDLSYIYESGIKIENGIVFAEKAGEYEISIIDSVSNISANVTIVVEEKVNYQFEVKFNNSFLNLYQAVFVDDCLTISGNYNSISIPFSYSIIGDDLYDKSIECNLTYKTKDEMVIDYVINYNFVQLNIQGRGEVNITLTLKENVNINYTFKIIID